MEENRKVVRKTNANSKVLLLIPSYNPNEITLQYTKELISKGFKHIVFVNDGSKKECDKYFDQIKEYPECSVLTHSVNLGKGRALKTGINHYLNNYDLEEFIGIVTADADGQHSPRDTFSVKEEVINNSDSLILGTRDFDQADVPFKSSFGNKITTLVFKFLYGKKINDTQTGLRGIPNSFLKQCLALPGERFEYEIKMLISAVKNKVNIIEKKIETIYYDSNRETHFDPIKDSLKIYGILLKNFLSFSVIGIVSFAIDILLFNILSKRVFAALIPIKTIFWATLIARIVSSLFNFGANKNIVFDNNKQGSSTLIKYYILSSVQLITSWGLVFLVRRYLEIDTTIIKIGIDFVLFFLSYQIQHRWVFKTEVS